MTGELAPRGFEAVKALAKAAGRRIETLLALGRSADPFFTGSPAQTRDAEWFAEWWKRLGLTARRLIHLRAIHYLLVALGNVLRPDGRPYENTEQCWKWLAEASAPARYLDLVPADAFVDRKNPPPRLHAELRDPDRDDEPRWSVDVEDMSWDLPEIDTDPGWALDFALPTPSVHGYDYSPADQPYLLEVWVEKSTMNDVLLPVCQEFGGNLVYASGFQSISNVREMLERVAAHGKPARIFYISDFDPAGDLMPTAVARQAEFWLSELAPGADIKLTPLALTAEQVREYRLPRTPIKEEDLRRSGFEEAYGEGAVELDALEALHPGELARLVREALAPYVDTTLPSRLRETEEAAQEEADDAWDDAVGHYQPDLDTIAEEARTITDRYREELERLNGQLQEELAPLRDKLRDIRQAIHDAVDEFFVDLPERPEPETDPPDEGAWLFDAGREYLEQLAHYKGRRSGEVEEVVVYTDGLTSTQRQTLDTIRAAGGAMNQRALMAALGLKAWPAAQRRLGALQALGAVEPIGKGTKNDPRLWRVVEPDGGPTEEGDG